MRFLKFFSGLVISFLLLEITLRLSSPVLGTPIKSWNTMEEAKVLKLESRSPVDDSTIFVLGNSTAHIGINPDVIKAFSSGKLSVFNAATNGSNIGTMSNFARSYLIPKHHARTLILFLAPKTMPDAPSADEVDVNDLNMSFIPPSAKEWLGEYSFLFKYRNNLRNPMIINTIRKSILSLKSGYGIVESWAGDLDQSGYSIFPPPKNTIPGGWSQKDLDSSAIYQGPLPKYTYQELARLLRVADRNDTRIVIASVPLPHLDSTYRLEVESLARSFKLDYIPGNDAIRSGKYFADEIHLNESGTLLFSEYIARQLVKLGLP